VLAENKNIQEMTPISHNFCFLMASRLSAGRLAHCTLGAVQ